MKSHEDLKIVVSGNGGPYQLPKEKRKNIRIVNAFAGKTGPAKNDPNVWFISKSGGPKSDSSFVVINAAGQAKIVKIESITFLDEPELDCGIQKNVRLGDTGTISCFVHGLGETDAVDWDIKHEVMLTYKDADGKVRKFTKELKNFGEENWKMGDCTTTTCNIPGKFEYDLTGFSRKARFVDRDPVKIGEVAKLEAPKEIIHKFKVTAKQGDNLYEKSVTVNVDVSINGIKLNAGDDGKMKVYVEAHFHNTNEDHRQFFRVILRDKEDLEICSTERVSHLDEMEYGFFKKFDKELFYQTANGKSGDPGDNMCNMSLSDIESIRIHMRDTAWNSGIEPLEYTFKQVWFVTEYHYLRLFSGWEKKSDVNDESNLNYTIDKDGLEKLNGAGAFSWTLKPTPDWEPW